MKLSVIIPCYNEENTIEKIIKLVEEVPIEKEIIVVDDGSTDKSPEILRSVASKKPYIKLILSPKNRGKGASIRLGLKETTGDYVIIQDADLEYNPQDYLKLLEETKKGTDIVYGSRFAGSYKNMTSLHYLGNRFLTFLTNILYGVKLTDMETCYKLIPGDFARSISIKSDRFDFEPEITSKILKSGLKITEVPISYNGRTWKEGKKITWRDGVYAIKTLIKFRFFDKG